MKRDVLLTLIVVATSLALVAIGFAAGQHNPPHGKLLVPTQRGTLHDLPGWACREVVDLRRQKLQLFEQMVKAYSNPSEPPPEFILFKLGNRKACRR